MKPGDTVICIKSHSMGRYVAGLKYKIEDVRPCKCGFLFKLVGVTCPPGYMGTICTFCREWVCSVHQYCWHGNFASISNWNQAETLVNELTETINQPVEI